MTAKERPILFSGPMVRAILNGTKTQTRRIVKPQPDESMWDAARANLGGDTHGAVPVVSRFGGIGLMRGSAARARMEAARPTGCGPGIGFVEPNIFCPYGQPGDRLWVKETVSLSEPCFLGGRPQPTVWYRADNNRPTWAERKWTPSIHCKRTLSRITLEITAVRVERLLAITEDDAIAEGCARNPDNRPPLPIPQFMDLWHRINGVESWNADPWVWVIEFRRVAQP